MRGRPLRVFRRTARRGQLPLRSVPAVPRTHCGAYTALARSDFKLLEDSGLEWYRSSEWARRGFCVGCGSSLFWERIDAPSISISAGSLDQPSGLRTVRHVFVADKADYYEITDGLEQLSGTSLPH